LASAGLVVLPILGPVAGALFALGGTAGAGYLVKQIYELPPPDLGSRKPTPALSGAQHEARDEALRLSLIQELRVMVDVAEGELQDPDILDRLASLERALLDVIPRVDHISGGDADAYTLRQTVRDYLPEALAGYRRLPTDYAASAPLPGDREGRTAHEALLQQLELLLEAILNIAERLPEESAQRFMRHTRFLEGRFSDRPGPDTDLHP
jgi:hypothetical protein